MKEPRLLISTLRLSSTGKGVEVLVTNAGSDPIKIRGLHPQEDLSISGNDGRGVTFKLFGLRAFKPVTLAAGESLHAVYELPEMYDFLVAQPYTVTVKYRARNWLYRPCIDEVDDLSCESNSVIVEIESGELLDFEARRKSAREALLVDDDKFEAWQRGEISWDKATTESEKYRAAMKKLASRNRGDVL